MSGLQSPVARRLRWYWQLEAGNALLVPGIAFLLVREAGGAPTPAFALAALACAWLLVVGALYWRAALRRMEGDARALQTWIPRLALMELPSLALTALAAIVLAIELAQAGGWTASLIAAACLATLAALEYVNYYKVQLQHFDNWADFRRLVTGRGFRRAHLARDIAAWRERRRTAAD